MDKTLDNDVKGCDNLQAREKWIDILRSIGIIIVILGHANPPLIKIIYAFHMPLFFVLSGYLWSDRRIQTKYNSLLRINAIRYLVPYFILCCINLILELCVSYISHGIFDLKTYTIGILYSRGSIEWMPNCSPLWFLTALFVTMCIFDAVMRFKHKTVRCLVIVMLGIFSALLSITDTFKLPWNIDTAMMGSVFFGIGYLLKEKRIIKKFESMSLIIEVSVCMCLLLVGLFSIYLNPIDLVNYNENRYGNVILMFIGACSFTFILFYLVYRITWNGVISRYLSRIGQHTIFVMAFDYFTGSIARGVLGKVGFENWLSEFCLKVLLLSIGCLIWTSTVNMIKSERVRKVLIF